MKPMTIAGFAALMLVCSNDSVSADGDERRAIQKQLDDACHAARESILIPLREQYTRECIEKYERDPDYCERFHSTYGNATAYRPALFLDIPECVRAFEYQKSR